MAVEGDSENVAQDAEAGKFAVQGVSAAFGGDWLLVMVQVPCAEWWECLVKTVVGADMAEGWRAGDRPYTGGVVRIVAAAAAAVAVVVAEVVVATVAVAVVAAVAIAAVVIEVAAEVVLAVAVEAEDTTNTVRTVVGQILLMEPRVGR